MHRSLRARLLAAAVIFAAVPVCAAMPAQAQVSVDISFDTFHDQLATHGSWVYSDRWGTVWQPGEVGADFRPYDTGGHWEFTNEYGWTWVSDYDWGDITFHYGRWVDDPDDGWLWMPGYVWSPAWVVWRSNNDYIGWMPMPPDDNFAYGRSEFGVSVSWDDPLHYYNDWYGPGFADAGSMWVFVNYGHIADRDYHRYVAPPQQVQVLVRQTTNITRYTVVNNYVVNKSVDPQRVARMAGHPINPVPARTVIKHPNMIATVARGEQARAQMIKVAPRGTGKPNSAPPPPPSVVNKLSDNTNQHRPQHAGTTHLFTKSALTQPGAAAHFHGGGGNLQTNGPAHQGNSQPALQPTNQSGQMENRGARGGNLQMHGAHENTGQVNNPPGTDLSTPAGNGNNHRAKRGTHENGTAPNSGQSVTPNPNNEGGTGDNGQNRHTHQMRQHNAAPAMQAPPPNEPTPDNMPPENMRGRHEHAPPPPPTDQGEGSGNGHAKKGEKPEKSPPPQ